MAQGPRPLYCSVKRNERRRRERESRAPIQQKKKQREGKREKTEFVFSLSLALFVSLHFSFSATPPSLLFFFFFRIFARCVGRLVLFFSSSCSAESVSNVTFHAADRRKAPMRVGNGVNWGGNQSPGQRRLFSARCCSFHPSEILSHAFLSPPPSLSHSLSLSPSCSNGRQQQLTQRIHDVCVLHAQARGLPGAALGGQGRPRRRLDGRDVRLGAPPSRPAARAAARPPCGRPFRPGGHARARLCPRAGREGRVPVSRELGEREEEGEKSKRRRRRMPKAKLKRKRSLGSFWRARLLSRASFRPSARALVFEEEFFDMRSTRGRAMGDDRGVKKKRA